MTAGYLLDCIGLIDEQYISEAEDFSPAARFSLSRIIALVSAAACFCIIAAAAALIANRTEDISAPPDISITGTVSVSETTCAPAVSSVSGTSVTSSEEIVSPAFSGYKEPEIMPEPFDIPPEGGGDGNYIFHAEVNYKLDGIDMEFINYVGTDEFEEWIREQKSADSTAVDEFPNLYSFIRHFDFPIDEAEEQLKLRQEVDSFMPDCITDEEIELILYGTPEEVAEQFAYPFVIRKGKNLYSTEWLYYHTIEDYKAAGITTEDVLSRVDMYSEIFFTDEAREAFSEKLSAFTGQEIKIESPFIPEKTEEVTAVDDLSDEEVEVFADDVTDEDVTDEDIE